MVASLADTASIRVFQPPCAAKDRDAISSIGYPLPDRDPGGHRPTLAPGRPATTCTGLRLRPGRARVAHGHPAGSVGPARQYRHRAGLIAAVPGQLVVHGAV